MYNVDKYRIHAHYVCVHILFSILVPGQPLIFPTSSDQEHVLTV